VRVANTALVQWLEAQPTEEQFERAMEEVQDALTLLQSLGHMDSCPDLIAVVKWAYASQVVPFELEGGCKCAGHCSS
jgi:hypothetical protein